MKTLSEIQKEQAEWSDRNFGPQSPERMIFGMMEELGELAGAHPITVLQDAGLFDCIRILGELCHLRLKKLQGIRHGDREIRELIKEKTEILEILAIGLNDTWHNEDYSCLELCSVPPTKRREVRKDSYGDLMIFGLGYVTAAGLGDAEEILNEVWETVRQRDWVKNPKDGVSE